MPRVPLRETERQICYLPLGEPIDTEQMRNWFMATQVAEALGHPLRVAFDPEFANMVIVLIAGPVGYRYDMDTLVPGSAVLSVADVKPATQTLSAMEAPL